MNTLFNQLSIIFVICAIPIFVVYFIANSRQIFDSKWIPIRKKAAIALKICIGISLIFAFLAHHLQENSGSFLSIFSGDSPLALKIVCLACLGIAIISTILCYGYRKKPKYKQWFIILSITFLMISFCLYFLMILWPIPIQKGDWLGLMVSKL